jgi:hypothetical protein
MDVFMCKKSKKMVCVECVITCTTCHLNFNKNYCIGDVCGDCKMNIITNSTNDITNRFPIEIIENIKEFI